MSPEENDNGNDPTNSGKPESDAKVTALPRLLKVQLDAGKRLALITANGQPTPGDFETCTLELLDHPEWKPWMNLLVDYRELINFDFSVDGIRRISQLFKDRAAELGDGKCAVVVPNLLIYGLFNMWYPWLPDELQWDVKAFRQFEEACLWLGIAPDNVQ
jgi:hypothetical protein